MATIHKLYTVGITPVAVSPVITHSGMDITIQNANSSGYVYVGSSGVSNSNYGYRILPNHAISFELSGRSSLYVVGSAPSMSVPVITTDLEEGI